MNPTHKKMLHLPFSTNTCCFWPFLDVIHRTQSYIIHTPHKNRDLYQLRPTTEIMMDVVPNWQPNFEPHPLGYRFLGLFDLSNQPKDTNSKSSLHRRAWPPACSPWGKSTCAPCFKLLTQLGMDISRRKSGSSVSPSWICPQIMLSSHLILPRYKLTI